MFASRACCTGFAILVTSAANATVVTTGCLEAEACTLAELEAGGTIAVDDVVFNNFQIYAETDSLFAATNVDPTGVFLAGISLPSSVGFSVSFDPIVTAEDGDDDIGLSFGYFAQVQAPSARSFSSVTGSALGSAVTGDSFLDVTTYIFSGFDAGGGEVYLGNSSFQQVSSDRFDLDDLLFPPSDPGFLSAFTDVEGRADNGSVSIEGFELSFELVPSPVPLLGSAPLLLVGIGTFGFILRRKSRSSS